MASYIISDFPSQSGSHCASTAISNLSHYYDINYSESLSFGLGSGLSFIYLYYYPTDASRIVFTRTPMFEKNFFQTLGIPFKWYTSDQVDWVKMKEYLNNNIPLLLLTDIYYLDFYRINENSFASHTLILLGYDESKNIAYVSDSLREGLLETRLDRLLYQAINVEKPPFYKKNVWSPIPSFTIHKDRCEMIRESLINNAKEMIDPTSQFTGIQAMKTLGNEIVDWVDIPEWRKLSNNVYRSLELIGTGGSGFRKLYADFIDEIINDMPFIEETGLQKRMETIILLYRRLSKQFYLAGSKGERTYLVEIQNILSYIYSHEDEFWSTILKRLQ